MLLIVGGGAMLLGACGGQEGESSAPLTKAQYIEEADVICVQTGRTYGKRTQAFLKRNPKADEEEVVSEVGVPVFHEMLGELDELGMPSGDEAEIEAFMQSLEDAIEEIEADPSGLLSGSQNPLDRSHKLGQAYGFKRCGSL